MHSEFVHMLVTNQMIVYKGMPHGPNRPKNIRAVLTHLDAWFSHYLFDGPELDSSIVGVPEEENSEEAEE